ncbi:MAG TPA: ferrochelatase [Candidatus Limnocylindria bacterium]|nr:ferrochelatase [Candidatus Limnocylindria bacterium]
MTPNGTLAGRGRLGVLLMTYGSPAGPHDMPRYLAAVRGGRPASDEVVAEFRRRYDVIGGSPLIPITHRQAAAVGDELTRRGVDARAAAGMRFSSPTIAEALEDLARAGCADVVGVVMSPQHSELLMAGYRRELEQAATALGDRAPEVTLAPAWYRHDGFIGAVAERISEAMPDECADVAVLLSAHSLPRRVADEEPGYLAQLGETAELVAERAGLRPDRWRFCWQSAGHEPGEWMTPDFADLLPELRRSGFNAVLVAPIQFLADHLEILYDVDVGARAQAEEAGLQFARIASLNVMPRFVAALADVALDAAGHRLPASLIRG